MQGAFDSFEHENLPRTKYDQIIDEASNKPGEQAFEKLISGRYLGEILRLIICELIDEGVLFLGQNTYKIEIPYSFDTAFLSLMELDPTDALLMIIGIFNHFFAVETTLAERQFFRALAKLVGRRAARLSACGIAAICTKKGYKTAHVGADGSVFNKYPHFKARGAQALREILEWPAKKPGSSEEDPVEVLAAEDGSGVGAALIAALGLSLAAVLLRHRRRRIRSRRQRDLEAFFCEARVPATSGVKGGCVSDGTILLVLLLFHGVVRGRTSTSNPLTPHTHVGADDEAAALESDGAHEGQPGVAVVGGGGEPEVDVLGVEGLAQQRHVVLPADDGADLACRCVDDSDPGTVTLSPDETFCAGGHELAMHRQELARWRYRER